VESIIAELVCSSRVGHDRVAMRIEPTTECKTIMNGYVGLDASASLGTNAFGVTAVPQDRGSKSDRAQGLSVAMELL